MEDGLLAGGWWQRVGGAALGTGSVLSVTLPRGTNTLRYTVQDAGGATASTTVEVFIHDMTNSDLFVATNALSVVPLNSDTSAQHENLLRWDCTNLLTLMIQNQGISNTASISLYLQPPSGGEQLLISQELTNWTAFGSAIMSAKYFPVEPGAYKVRAEIQPLGLSDPDTNNNSYLWSLGDAPPRIEDYQLIANATGTADAVFSAYDPNGGTLNYAVVTPPAYGTAIFNGATASYVAGAGYVGSDTFTYQVTCGAGTSRFGSVSIEMQGVPQVSGGITVTGQVGHAFAYHIQANRKPYLFDAQTQGTSFLPWGLRCDSFRGDITGTPDESGTFTLSLSAANITGEGASNLQLVILSANLEPIFLKHPQSWNGVTGMPASFDVFGGGATPLYFQWQRNGTNVVGATNSIFSSFSTQSSQVGRYQCIVSNWAGAATSAVATLSLNPFTVRYPLLVTYAPSEGGYVTLSPQPGDDGKYTSNTVVTMTAVPLSDHIFNSWSGQASGTNNSVQLTMNGIKLINANFDTFVESVSAPSNLTGAGSAYVNQPMTYNASGAACNYGHAVQYRFDWGDGAISSWSNGSQAHVWSSAGAKGLKAQARCAVNTTKISVWSADLMTLSVTTLPLVVNSSPEGAGTIGRNPFMASYSYGNNVTLQALPAAHWVFDRWTGDVPTSNTLQNPLLLVMTQVRTVTVVFASARTLHNTPELWLLEHYPLVNDFASAALSDTDGDGMLAWQEWVAGTDPTNIHSVFSFKGAGRASGSGLVVRWPSLSNRFYSLSQATNLLSGSNSFAILQDASNMPATPIENCYTAAVQGVGPYYYKLEVHE